MINTYKGRLGLAGRKFNYKKYVCLLNDILKMDWKYNQLLTSRYIPCESLFLEAILNLNKIRIFQLLNTFKHFGSPL